VCDAIRTTTFFKSYLDPKGDLSIDQATTLLHDLLPTADKYENRGQPGMIGCVVLDIARQVQYTHPAQTDIVRLLRNLERSNRLNGLVTDDVSRFNFVFHTKLRYSCTDVSFSDI
jgi:hypothetical protein